jgi:hypothetical protein
MSTKSEMFGRMLDQFVETQRAEGKTSDEIRAAFDRFGAALDAREQELRASAVLVQVGHCVKTLDGSMWEIQSIDVVQGLINLKPCG